MSECRSYSSGPAKPSPFHEDAINSNVFDKAKATPLPAADAEVAAQRLTSEPSTAGMPFVASPKTTVHGCNSQTCVKHLQALRDWPCTA